MYLQTLNRIMGLMYSPDDGGGIVEPMTRDDILAEMDKIDDKPEEDTEDEQDNTEDEQEEETDEQEEEEDTEEEEGDELEDLENELGDPKDDKELKLENEEDLELIHPVSRQAILKKYPNVFKDFPYLEKAYFREQQYTSIFTTPQDAKIAVTKAQIMDRFDADLMDGNIEGVLNAVKKTDGTMFKKVADNYLETLARVDNDAFLHVVGNVIKNTIMGMVSTGNTRKDKNLLAAAEIVNQYVFNTEEFIPPSKLYDEKEAPKNNPKEAELTKKEEEFNKRQFDTARSSVDSRFKGAVKHTIESRIDPKGNMSEYVKRNAVRDAIETLDKQMSNSTRYKALVQKAWAKAKEDNYSQESVERVRRIHITHAKTLLDSVIKKSRNEALKGMGLRVKEDKTEKVDKKDNKEGKSSAPVMRRPTKNVADIPKDMSTMDAWNLLEGKQ